MVILMMNINEETKIYKEMYEATKKLAKKSGSYRVNSLGQRIPW
jgi:hypothetical protein